MKKTLNINTGSALLLNDRTDALSGYDSVAINAGSMLVSAKVYDKLTAMGVSINSGNTAVIDVKGEIVELAKNTVVTAAMSFGGCFIVCEGNIVVEDAKGLAGITGMYANRLFHPESADLNAISGITVSQRISYPDGAKLHLRDMLLGDDAHIVLDGSLQWVYGSITALDGDALGRLQQKGTAFQCRKLIIHNGLYERFGGMFKTEGIVLVPDGYAFTGDLTLDVATSVLYGDKLFINGDFMIPYDKAGCLREFSSLIVKGTATMPVAAAKDFKACGKADDFDLYEGALMEINGDETFDHAQLQSAIKLGIAYTLRVNGEVAFLDDVTAEDMGAIAAMSVNGAVYAPGEARGVLVSKIKGMNGEVLDISRYNSESGKDDAAEEADASYINAGTYRL